MEKEILKLLAIIMEDNRWSQIYPQQIKMLFDMLEREQKTYCQDGLFTTNKNIGGNYTGGNFGNILGEALTPSHQVGCEVR